VDAEVYDGQRLPVADDSVDTVVLFEVLEHLQDPAAVLREARRVATRNVLVTTPNCTQSFGDVPVEFSHMLDVDHCQFFTVDTMRALLQGEFARAEVTESHPLDEHLASLILPRAAHERVLAAEPHRAHPPALLLKAPGRGVGCACDACPRRRRRTRRGRDGRSPPSGRSSWPGCSHAIAR
jgi:2-polyprenyl-3-methyl-5-hydroxy-6-metoxy-1,4-benzoquinol methylase